MKSNPAVLVKRILLAIIVGLILLTITNPADIQAESKTVPFLKNRFSKYSNTYYMGRGMESGDLDGDGYEDLIVGNPSSISNTGVVFLFEGSDQGIDTENPLEFKGAATSTYLGSAVNSDDLNGDGIDDLVIQSGYSSRRVYIYWGRENFFDIVDDYLDADVTITIPTNNGGHGYGYTLPISDLNNDGYKDLVVSDGVTRRGGAGNVGKVWVFLGSETKWDTDLDGSTDAEVMVEGSSQNTFSAWETYTGDINNDGADDLLVNAYRNDLGRVGGLSVYFGGDSSIFATPGTYYTNTDSDFLIRGTYAYEYFSFGDFKIGDFDGDDLADLFVTDYRYNNYGGALRIWLGKDNFTENTTMYPADSSISIAPSEESMYFAYAFEFEDMDNNGSVDLLASSPRLSTHPDTSETIQGGVYFIPNENFSSLENGDYDIADLYKTFIPGEDFYVSPPNGYFTGIYMDTVDTDNNGLKEIVFSNAYSPVGRFDIYEFGNAGLTITEEAGYADTAAIAGTLYNPPSEWEEIRTSNIFDISDTDNWDDYHTFYNPNLIYEDSTYKLWYSGSDGSNWRIGYATSSDGSTWSRYNSNSCSGMTGDGCIFDKSADTNWDDNGMLTGSVINDSGTYKTWYTGHDGSNWRIGYATSADGISWTRNSGNGCALSGDGCVMTLGAADDWDDAHIGYASVIKDGATYKMWYSGNDGSGWVGIGYATSADGVSWTKYPGNLCTGLTGDGCLIGVGSSSSFDEIEIFSPTVIKDGSTYKMWYSGKDTDYNWQTGYATSTDGLSWTKYASNPVVSNSSTYSIDGNGVLAPFVLDDSGTYKMWYSAYDSKTYRGAYATSSDGTTWSKLTSTISDTYSVDVPTLNYRINGGSWLSCTANDGDFNEVTETFTCISSLATSSSSFTYGLQAIDASSIYYQVVTGTGSGVINLGLEEEPIVDIIPPDDSFGNTDFEITKIEGESVDDKGSKDDRGNNIGKAVTTKNRPKVKFEIIQDDNSGMSHYEIRVTNTNDGLTTKDGEDYKWVGNIPHDGSDGIKRERDGVEIKYDDDKIEIKPIDGKYNLDDGAYYFKVRAFDNAGNFSDSDEVKVYVGREELDSPSSEDNPYENQGEITLENIGSIPYNLRYKTYYYTSNNLVFTGTGSTGIVSLKIDDEEASNAPLTDGRFSIGSTLSTGTHNINLNGIEFKLVIDPTRALFPDSLK